MKEFNTTGSCNPERHYIVDTDKRFKSVENLIEKGKYLAIRGMNEGYLVTFDFSKNKSTANPQWLEVNGKWIFEAVV